VYSLHEIFIIHINSGSETPSYKNPVDYHSAPKAAVVAVSIGCVSPIQVKATLMAKMTSA